jgi:hypothetical protein
MSIEQKLRETVADVLRWRVCGAADLSADAFDGAAVPVAGHDG